MSRISKEHADLVFRLFRIDRNRLWWRDDAPVTIWRAKYPIDSASFSVKIDGFQYSFNFARVVQILRDGMPKGFNPYFLDGDKNNTYVSNISTEKRPPNQRSTRHFQSSKMPIDLILACVEVIDDRLCWKDFKHLRKPQHTKKERYPAGEPVGVVISALGSPYVRINILGGSFQVAYGRIAMAAKLGKLPDYNVCFSDGDKTNLKISNLSERFVPWWEVRGMSNPRDKK